MQVDFNRPYLIFGSKTRDAVISFIIHKGKIVRVDWWKKPVWRPYQEVKFDKSNVEVTLSQHAVKHHRGLVVITTQMRRRSEVIVDRDDVAGGCNSP